MMQLDRQKSTNTKVSAKEGGIVVVEFAVGMVVVLLLLLAAAELGRIYYSYNTLTKSVRAGARYLSINALNPAYVVDLTNQVVADTSNIVVSGSTSAGTALLPGFTTGDIVVSQTTAPSGISNPYITVSASYNYSPLVGALPSVYGSESTSFQFTMVAESTMRVLR